MHDLSATRLPSSRTVTTRGPSQIAASAAWLLRICSAMIAAAVKKKAKKAFFQLIVTMLMSLLHSIPIGNFGPDTTCVVEFSSEKVGFASKTKDKLLSSLLDANPSTRNNLALLYLKSKRFYCSSEIENGFWASQNDV